MNRDRISSVCPCIQLRCIGKHLHTGISKTIVNLYRKRKSRTGCHCQLLCLRCDLHTFHLFQHHRVCRLRSGILFYNLLEVLPVLLRLVGSLSPYRHHKFRQGRSDKHTPVDPCRRLATYNHFAQVAAIQEDVIFVCPYRCRNLNRAQARSVETPVLQRSKGLGQLDALQ